jgi:hypothetical protein
VDTDAKLFRIAGGLVVLDVIATAVVLRPTGAQREAAAVPTAVVAGAPTAPQDPTSSTALPSAASTPGPLGSSDYPSTSNVPGTSDATRESATPGEAATPSESAAAIATGVPSESAEGLPTPVPATVGHVGQRVAVKDAGLTVNAVRSVLDFGPDVKPRAGHAFLVVDLTLDNPSTRTQPYSPFYFRLRDAAGTEYRAGFDADNGLRSGELQPDETLSGEVAFEVPTAAQGLVLSYKPVIPGDYEPLLVHLDEGGITVVD